MKIYKHLSTVFIAAFLSTCFYVSALANSSWVWISETRPYDILPFVIIGTLAIECLAIHSATDRSNIYKTFVAVTFGNLASFLFPYLMYSNTTPYADAGYSLKQILNRGPYYTVSAAFLILTVIIELPTVYFFLRKNSPSRKKLAVVTVGVNILTTFLVAVLERILCYGRW